MHVLLEMLTGRPPADTSTGVALVDAVWSLDEAWVPEEHVAALADGRAGRDDDPRGHC